MGITRGKNKPIKHTLHAQYNTNTTMSDIVKHLDFYFI